MSRFSPSFWRIPCPVTKWLHSYSLLLAAGITLAAPSNAADLEPVAGAGLLYVTSTDSVANLARPFGINGDDRVFTYVTDPVNHILYRMDPWAIAHVMAGDGIPGFQGDGGPSESARLNNPQGVAVDSGGNVFVADTGNHRIRRIPKDITGIDTFAGSSAVTLSGIGGPATKAGLDEPVALAFDAQDTLYIADATANRILSIGADGKLQLFAGGGTVTDDPPGTTAKKIALDRPMALTAGPDGSLYVAEEGGKRVRMISPDGSVQTLADGKGKNGITLQGPRGLLVSPETGELFISDGNRLLSYLDGALSVYAGTGEPGYKADDLPLLESPLYHPAGLAWDYLLRRLEIADEGNAILRVSEAGNLLTFTRRGLGTDRNPADARIVWPEAVAYDKQGRLLFTNSGHRLVWDVEPTPDGDLPTTVNEVMGDGSLTANDGSNALQAGLTDPTGVATAPDGSYYVADAGNHVILHVGTDGKVFRVAGTGKAGFSGDGGSGRSAALNAPTGLVVDGEGTLYISDTGNQRIRRLGTDGVMSTVAGNGSGGYGGDNGPATGAMLNGPTALALDGQGRLYMADTGNNRIRRVDGDGAIRTVAGSGKAGFTGDDGPATEAQLLHPRGVWVDGGGILFLSDSDNNRIRQVGKDGTIQTIAGTGEPGIDAETDSLQAHLYVPAGLTGSPDGNLVFADRNNHLIRELMQVVTPLGIIPAGPKGSTSPPATTAGDLNGDGKITVLDAIMALQSTVGLLHLTAAQLSAGDFNGDGKIDVGEIVRILRLSVGLG